MKNPTINLAVIVLDVSSEYLMHQFCSHYSKYEPRKVFLLIHSEKGKRVNYVETIFRSYFKDLDVKFSLYEGYTVEEEGIFFTRIFNYETPKDEWLCTVDLDEFITIERIPAEIFSNYNLIRGVLIDRVAGDAFNPNRTVFENYNENHLLYNFIASSFPYKKSFLKKGDIYLRISNGHHRVFFDIDNEKRIKTPDELVPIYHFKWRDDSIEFLEHALKGKQSETHAWVIEVKEQLDILKNLKLQTLSKSIPTGIKQIEINRPWMKERVSLLFEIE